MIELFVNEWFRFQLTSSTFSSLQARRLYWVAMVRQDFGPKSGIRLYLGSFMGFKRNKTIATALGVIQDR